MLLVVLRSTRHLYRKKPSTGNWKPAVICYNTTYVCLNQSPLNAKVGACFWSDTIDVTRDCMDMIDSLSLRLHEVFIIHASHKTLLNGKRIYVFLHNSEKPLLARSSNTTPGTAGGYMSHTGCKACPVSSLHVSRRA